MTAERTPRHATLHARKVLAGRMAVLRAFECGDCQVGGPPEQFEAREAEKGLLAGFSLPATGKIDGEAPTREPLDEFLANQDELRVKPKAKTARLAGQSGLEERLTTLSGKLQGFNCRQCAGEGGHVCKAHELDDATVAARGVCIAELTEIFNWAKAIAITAYDLFAPGQNALASWAKNVDVRFETEGREAFRHQGALPRIAASVEFADKPGALKSFVNLAFSPDHFDAAALHLCPYALIHELVAHAFLSAAGPIGLRVPAGADDGWAEGWMDAVAFSILGRVTTGIEPFRAPTLPAWLDEAKVTSRAGDLHDARYKDPIYQFNRTLGRDRAGFFAVYRRLRATSRAGVMQEDVLLRACLLINVLGAPSAVTARLLATPRLFNGTSRELNQPERKVFEALADFLDHHELGTLEAALR